MEEIEQSPKRAPRFECGYGWIVVAATFFVNFIADGLVYSFGILLVELLETFKQERASTVVIGSILFGFMYIIGMKLFQCCFETVHTLLCTINL